MNSIINNIYNHIMDEESRAVFEARLDFGRIYNISALNRIINDYRNLVKEDERLNEFRKTILALSDIVIFGAGVYGRRLEQLVPKVAWKAFIDGNPRELVIHGIPVKKSRDFYDDYAGEFVAIPSKAYFFEMKRELLLHNIPEEKIIDATVVYDVTEGRQYFNLEALPHNDNEVFVDGGCYDGTSTIQFAKWCGHRNYKSFCFEPDHANCKRIERVLNSYDIDHYELIEKGLWDKKDTLSFVKKGPASKCCEDDGDLVTDFVEVTSIDETLEGVPVTFIKMDIEGAELKALYGAKNMIQTHRPKLAICVYHKPEDIIEIPAYVLSLCPDYRLYFRHYSTYHAETVMYAV